MATPLDTFFLEMEERIVSAIVEQLRQANRHPALDLLPALGVEPLKVCSAKEVASMIGTSRVQSVYQIPEEELPRVRRIGCDKGYLGINVLCYIHGLPPVDIAAAIEQYRKRLLQDRPTVSVLHPRKKGKTRIV